MVDILPNKFVKKSVETFCGRLLKGASNDMLVRVTVVLIAHLLWCVVNRIFDRIETGQVDAYSRSLV